MQHRILNAVAIAITLTFCASLSLAAESKAAAAGETKSAETAKPAKKSAKVKLVDINSASKAELMKLPGVGAAEADKIIADRPFLTKAHLVTHNILPEGVYEGLKGQVMAKPNKATEAKLKEMEKKR